MHTSIYTYILAYMLSYIDTYIHVQRKRYPISEYMYTYYHLQASISLEDVGVEVNITDAVTRIISAVTARSKVAIPILFERLPHAWCMHACMYVCMYCSGVDNEECGCRWIVIQGWRNLCERRSLSILRRWWCLNVLIHTYIHIDTHTTRSNTYNCIHIQIHTYYYIRYIDERIFWKQCIHRYIYIHLWIPN